MTLFYSKTHQTFEVIKPKPVCLANAGDALGFVGIIWQNQVTSIKNLLSTHTVLVCTLRVSFFLKYKKKKFKRKYTPDFEVFQQSLSNKCLPLVEIHFCQNTRKGENIFLKKS